MSTIAEIDFKDDEIPAISFFVEGIPSPGGSKKYVGHSKKGKAILIDMGGDKTRFWRQAVSIYARQTYHGAPLKGAVSVRFQFYMPRPKTHFHTSPKRLGELRRGAPLYHTVRPDVLKLSRSTEDALTGICWQDDSANCVLTASKLYSDRPGCQITITQLK